MSMKLFNQVLSYRLTQPIPLRDIQVLSDALETKAARQIGSQELSTMGFVEPLGVEGEFAERIGAGSVFISARKSERLLPGIVVKQSVEAKVNEIEKEQDRKVYAKEKARIKDEVVQAMLPHAFVTHSRINALITPTYIFVETSSAKKADELLSLLRHAIGSLPVRPVIAKVSPIATFTHWVQNGKLSVPDGFSLGESFQSRGASEESSTLSGKNVDLSEDDIVQLIEAGRRINQLELIWHTESGGERIDVTYTVNEMLGIKGIQWPEDLHQQIKDDMGEDDDKVTEARASLLLISSLFNGLLSSLLHALGGEEVPGEHPLAAYLEEHNATLVDDEEEEEDLV
ncbi:recombination-associated protein RdgC [Pseudomonas stutzeri]|uniref:recombination-associated protein RdgC n=1 Tax=Stutzerimonas stutzeri TaxID=316 RepID=UPI00210923DC|nr:recombination-associated protein RdgC [Stutzerimonas stutzeri]MCQ4311733.1 recombination-associated protein RdgC [Stutzerimonas stutzeri]